MKAQFNRFTHVPLSSKRIASQRRPRKNSSGLALVIVLASLVFLVALGIAFLLNSTTELRSSKTFSEGGRAKMLAQTAVSLAMAQISDGTKGVDGSGNVLAWASQPGMIRTYDTNGNAAAWYKLYSWDVMTSSGTFNFTAAEQPPATWYTQKGIFTDLNEPLSSGTSKIYPIIDGNKLTLNVTDGASGNQVVTYDDGAGGQAIDGFSVSAGTPKNPAAGSNPAPMPVKWLYVLKQGQIVAPTGGSGNTASFSGLNVPTDTNPIVGRVAFWTDDESCKININTASEGVYWDTPRAVSAYEDTLKSNQPVGGEYQRYPGHPAMTSLSTVLKKPTGSSLTDAQWAQFLYTIVPRVTDGGSSAGTINTAWAAPNVPLTVACDADRLYGSVDELIFNPNRASNATVAGSSQVLNKTTLERDKFFLTASSRSPDVNLFNKPRVCNWPITLDRNTGNPVTTPYDKLIAFCTTMRNDLGAGAYRFHFERQDSNSSTTDLPGTGTIQGLGRNRMLLSYLQYLAKQPIPGFGGTLAAKYGNDTDQILIEMFDYIRGATNLIDRSLPNGPWYSSGIPGAGQAPWNGRLGEGQVVPIDDSKNASVHGFGRYRTVQGASLLFIAQADGDDPVIPQDTSHNVVGTAPFPDTSQVDVATGKVLPTATIAEVPAGKIRLQAMFLPQFFCSAVGAPWNIGNFQWSVDLSQLTWPGNVPMGFPAADTRYNQHQHSEDETGFGDQYGLLQLRQASVVSGTSGLVLSIPIDVPKAGGVFHFQGGDITIKIYAADRIANPLASSAVVQTVTMHFDAADFPLPKLSSPVYDYNNGVPKPGVPAYNYRSFGNSTGFYNPANPNFPLAASGGRQQAVNQASGWILNADVIRSVGVKSGDTRLVAAQKVVPASMFAVNANYQSTTEHVRGEHTFFDGYGRPYYGAALGRLVAGLNYLNYKPNATTFPGINELNSIDNNPAYCFNLAQYTLASDIPLDGVAVGKDTSASSSDIPGDWDNGPFDVRDGPFINMADEGDKSSDPQIDPYEWKLKSKAGGSFANVTALFTPNRQIPSPVMFGSLPSGVLANRPWQTLLFRPQPGHPGNRGYKNDGTAAAGMPPDHVLLDLFHMPVVEPYAISEPLSTAGRINMNYQIVPFAYINRDTGIRALLKAEKVIAIEDTKAASYKYNVYKAFSNPPVRNPATFRYDVNADETLKGFLKKFNTDHDIFRSASEVCELNIVPIDSSSPSATYDTMVNYWKTHQLTGDNSKERIYATLYPRLTTKSNTFTIHFRVQALKKVTGTMATTWDEGKDRITGEYRGSQTVERYIDPNNPQIPDYANPSSTDPISTFYKFRTVLAKQFTP